MGFPALLLLLSLFPIEAFMHVGAQLSPPQRPWERKKKRARGARWEGEERREAPAFSLFPSFPARFLFFDYCYFYWDLCEGELALSIVSPPPFPPVGLQYNAIILYLPTLHLGVFKNSLNHVYESKTIFKKRN